MLRKAFTTWKERHASWQQGHAKVARAAALWHNRALAGAWQQWKESAIYQQEIRLRLTGAVGEFAPGLFVSLLSRQSLHAVYKLLVLDSHNSGFTVLCQVPCRLDPYRIIVLCKH